MRPYRAQSITVVRIYLREGEHLLTKIMDFLHNEEKVSGVTVLQGIMGFGRTAKFGPAACWTCLWIYL